MKNDKKKRRVRTQYAALPYRLDENGETLVMLVTSRETKRWVAPKGWPIKDSKPHVTAKREAYEEAGLVGDVRKKALGSYRYEKRLQSDATVQCKVKVFPLRVKEQLPRWPEEQERQTRWFRPEEAAAVVHEKGLSEIIRQLEEKAASWGRPRARS